MTVVLQHFNYNIQIMHQVYIFYIKIQEVMKQLFGIMWTFIIFLLFS